MNESNMSTSKFWQEHAAGIYAQVNASISERRAHLMAVMSGTSDSSPWYAEMEAEEQELFFLEWTAEITASRRADWNAWVKSQGGKIADKAVQSQQARQGWTLADLKRAVKAY